MSFCGFVSFGASNASETAESSMRRWLDTSANTVAERTWQTSSSSGRFVSYSFVAEPRASATLEVIPGGLLVGDVPLEWARGSADQPSAARLLTRTIDQIGVADTPDREFACSLWSDALERLMLLRCPMGTRALYYTGVARSWLAFASTPEPLRAIPWSTSAIDHAGVASSLILGGVDCVPRDTTLFTNLKRLPAGEALAFSKEGISRVAVPFWPDASERGSSPDHAASVPKTLRRLLEGAVKRRSTGGATIGTLFSGGLDSSAVLGLVHMQRDSSQQLFAYTSHRGSDEGLPLDTLEHSIAIDMIDRLGSVTHRSELVAPPRQPAALSSKDLLERPLPDLVRLNYGHLIETAARDKCDVVFTGWGGDEMASSRTRLHVLGLLAEGKFQLAASSVFNTGPSLVRSVARTIINPLLDGIRGQTRWNRNVDEVMKRAFAGRPLAHFPGLVRRYYESLSVQALRRNRLRRPGLHVTMELFDWLAQRQGISVVHPLLDREVVLFADRLPVEWIRTASAPRRAFREAVSDLMSATAIGRQKSPLSGCGPDPTRWAHYVNYQSQRLDELAKSDNWLHEFLDLHFVAKMNREMTDWRVWQQSYPLWCLGAGAIIVSGYPAGSRPTDLT
jgi:asparagine synthetase B (glutamine-hydrolysing)